MGASEGRSVALAVVYDDLMRQASAALCLALCVVRLCVRRHVEEMSARLGETFDAGAALGKYNEEVGRRARNKMDAPPSRPPATPQFQRTPQGPPAHQQGQQKGAGKGGDKGAGKGATCCLCFGVRLSIAPARQAQAY